MYILREDQFGLGFRAIGKFLNVSNVSVLYWVRKAAEQMPTIENPLSIRVMGIDEMWHYCQKKKRKVWLWLSICRDNKRILAFEL